MDSGFRRNEGRHCFQKGKKPRGVVRSFSRGGGVWWWYFGFWSPRPFRG